MARMWVPKKDSYIVVLEDIPMEGILPTVTFRVVNHKGGSIQSRGALALLAGDWYRTKDIRLVRAFQYGLTLMLQVGSIERAWVRDRMVCLVDERPVVFRGLEGAIKLVSRIALVDTGALNGRVEVLDSKPQAILLSNKIRQEPRTENNRWAKIDV